MLGVVMGLRAFISGPRPAGSTALGVLRGAAKPILFVPPEAYFPSAFEPRRLLVPLDGTTRDFERLPRISSATFKPTPKGR